MVLRLNKQAKEYCPSEAKSFSSLTSLNTFVNMEEINVKMLFEFLLPMVSTHGKIWLSKSAFLSLYILQKRIETLKYLRKGTWQENDEGKTEICDNSVGLMVNDLLQEAGFSKKL